MFISADAHATEPGVDKYKPTPRIIRIDSGSDRDAQGNSNEVYLSSHRFSKSLAPSLISFLIVDLG